MKVKILGVKIDNLTMDEVLQEVEVFLTDNQQHYIVTPNPEFLVKAQKDKEFKEILNRADLAIPDGMGLIFASRFLGQPLKGRVTGTDLMEKICQRAALRGWSVFLIGDREDGLAEETANQLKNKYSGLKITGSSFNDVILKGVFKGTSSKILFIASGAPTQEKWIAQNLAKMPSVGLAMGVGGAFNFISGRVQRAPRFLREVGLEWFWRLFCQPRRIGRIFRAVIVFPWMVVRGH